MNATTLEGRRVLVVGATSGIGRAFAIQAVQVGAQVAMVARRVSALADTVEAAGGGATIVADLRDPDDCARIGTEAKDLLGAIDVVFVAAGTANLCRVEDATLTDWSVAFQTNVIGINLLIRALCPALAPRAIVAACSSETVGHPRWGLVPYGASKAALEESLRGWRLEHPEFRFSCVAVGATFPTEFAASWDPVRLGRAMEAWARTGTAQAELMQTDHVAGVLVGTFGVAAAYPGVSLEHLTVRSPSGIVDNTDSMLAGARKNNVGL